MRKLLLFLLLIPLKSVAQTLETDRLALVAIYNAIPVGNHSDFTTWIVPGTPGDSPCGWAGVTCEGGRVTKLDLGDYFISAALPPQIGNLTALTYLDLRGAGNEFGTWEGDIPEEFGNLVNLEYLNLYGTRVGRDNMDVLGNLTKLKTLYITAYGTIPGAFANLTNLEVLFLGTNEPMDIPDPQPFPLFLTNMTHLKELYIMQQIEGAVPPEIGNLSNLETLEIANNYELTSLPAEIGMLSKLKKLRISLVYPDETPMPFQISNLTNLEEFLLEGATYTGTLPTDIGKLTKLQRLTVHAHMNGPIPTQLGTLPGLNFLDLRFNSFSGPIPDLSNIPVSGYVNIASNAFTFEGMESNITRLDAYAPQALIDAYLEGPLCAGCIASHMRVTTAGGTIANNTYKLFKNNVLLRTQVGDELIALDGEGIYRAEVTNSIVTGLKLVTKTYASIKLPVTLVSFEAKSESNQTKLTWKTTSETNNKGFEIERSADARTFERIGFVDGSGDTKENQFYHFTDLNPLATSYYRLKQLDYDGKFEYSRTIAVKRDNVAISIYPNPAQAELTVTGAPGDEAVSVFAQTGKPVIVNAKLSAGKLDVKDLKEGIYTIKIGGFAKKLLIKR
jgi:hypothetical protein